jgi:hypothetical protein
MDHIKGRPEIVESIDDIRIAMSIICPICEADTECACDQFQAPHALPFTVHIERLEVATGKAEWLKVFREARGYSSFREAHRTSIMDNIYMCKDEYERLLGKK